MIDFMCNSGKQKPYPEVSISQHKYNLNYYNPNATGRNPTPLIIPCTNIPIQVFFRHSSLP